MNRPLRCFAVGALLVVIGCTGSHDSGVSDSSRASRLEYLGFSIIPPQGKGWQHLPNQGAGRQLLGFDDLYIKAISPNQIEHAYVVAHRIQGKSSSPRILEESFDQFIKPKGAPRISSAGSAPPNCLGWQMTHEGTEPLREVASEQPSWISKHRGYLCSHPDAPAYVIESGYFDTFLRGAPSLAAGEGESFLHGFALAPLGVKVAQFTAGDQPRGVVLGDGALWLTQDDAGAVSRIDPQTGSLVAAIPVGKKPAGLAIGAGAVWVPNWSSNTVSRIDPRTNYVTATISVGQGPNDVAVSNGSVWVSNQKSHSLSRIDAATNAVTATIPTGGIPVAIAANDTGVWVEHLQTDEIWRVDPGTNQIANTIHVGQGRHIIVLDGSAVWVSNNSDNSVSKIDPATNRVIATVAVGRAPSGLAVTADALWVANFSDGTVSRVDPRTNRVVGQPIPVGESPFLMIADGRTVWVLCVWHWTNGTLSQISY